MEELVLIHKAASPYLPYGKMNVLERRTLLKELYQSLSEKAAHIVAKLNARKGIIDLGKFDPESQKITSTDRAKLSSLIHPDVPSPHLFPDEAYIMGYSVEDIFAMLDRGADVNSKVTGISILQLFINESNWEAVDSLTIKYQAAAI